MKKILLSLALTAASLAAHAADLTVSAAASLTNAFKELAPLFQARHAGTQVLLNFAASDALLAQIAKGAPVDVFASADMETMDKAAAQNLLLAGSRQLLAHNALVVVTPADAAAAPKALADLVRPEIQRIAIGKPEGVPAGRYAKGALEAARLWEAVEPKAVFATNVRQALDYVARGEVEAGFVYATDAAAQRDKVRIAFDVATATPIEYPIAVVGASAQAALAREFLAFLQSPEGRAVMAKYGFRP